MLHSNPHQFQFQPYHERYILTAGRKTKKRSNRRFSVSPTIVHAMHCNKLINGQTSESAGCVSNAKVYMAFTPNEDLQVKIRQMMDAFDQGMKQLEREV